MLKTESNLFLIMSSSHNNFDLPQIMKFAIPHAMAGGKSLCFQISPWLENLNAFSFLLFILDVTMISS